MATKPQFPNLCQFHHEHPPWYPCNSSVHSFNPLQVKLGITHLLITFLFFLREILQLHAINITSSQDAAANIDSKTTWLHQASLTIMTEAALLQS
jgi:hypothetical protein